MFSSLQNYADKDEEIWAFLQNLRAYMDFPNFPTPSLII